MIDKVVHLAGPIVMIDGRLIQRCVVCGEKLLDSKNAMVAVPTNRQAEDDTELAHWEEGYLIEFSGSQQVALGMFESEGPLPDEFCLSLVEL